MILFPIKSLRFYLKWFLITCYLSIYLYLQKNKMNPVLLNCENKKLISRYHKIIDLSNFIYDLSTIIEES